MSEAKKDSLTGMKSTVNSPPKMMSSTTLSDVSSLDVRCGRDVNVVGAALAPEFSMPDLLIGRSEGCDDIQPQRRLPTLPKIVLVNQRPPSKENLLQSLENSKELQLEDCSNMNHSSVMDMNLGELEKSTDGGGGDNSDNGGELDGKMK